MKVKRFFMQIVVVIVCGMLFSTHALAGHDEASVPDDQIPWSGYWWPKNTGQIVKGYLGLPSPLEKYDGYVTGYYPASATEYGLEHEYDPNAYPWVGHCDDWAAASVLEEEPDHPGDLLGIQFNVGDKKGLLTLNYDKNYAIVRYGNRYTGSGDDINDIYPGGSGGFHKILVEYIKNQGLPIVMDLDPREQVWSYPAYKYQMDWQDSGNRRHVTCKVWFVDDSVSPDFVGTSTFTQTFTYWVEIDANGNVTDAPGEWEGDSVDNHPDFLWFPTFLGGQSFLSDEKVREIVNCNATGSDDRFEDNDDMDSAYPITGLLKNKFYCAFLKDPDYYRVSLSEGDDFMAFALTTSDDLEITVLDGSGREVGTKGYHLSQMEEVLESGDYYVFLDPFNSTQTAYQIEFFSSPSVFIPHLADGRFWDTKVTLINTDFKDIGLRFNLFGETGDRTAKKEYTLGHGHFESYSLNNVFSSECRPRDWIKLLELESGKAPLGFLSYEGNHRVAHLPLVQKGARELYLPHIPSIEHGWWLGIALLNLDAAAPNQVHMTAYDKNGKVVGEKHFTLGANANRVALVQDLWDGMVPPDAAWIKFSGSSDLIGFFLMGTDVNPQDPGLCGLNFFDSASFDTTLYIPDVATGNGWWTGIVLLNPSDRSLALTIRGYTGDGDLLKESSLILSAHSNWVGYVEELFTEWNSGISWVEIESAEPTGGYELLGNGSTSLGAIQLPTSKCKYMDMYVLRTSNYDEEWAGIVFLNPNERKSDVWGEPYDKDGNRLMPGEYLWYNVPNGVGGMCNAVGTVEDIFPGIPEGTSYLVIHSDAPIIGLETLGDFSGEKFGILPVVQVSASP